MGRVAQAARRPGADVRQQRRRARLVRWKVVQLQCERHGYGTRLARSFALGEYHYSGS